jgi:hypothetical protein
MIFVYDKSAALLWFAILISLQTRTLKQRGVPQCEYCSLKQRPVEIKILHN